MLDKIGQAVVVVALTTVVAGSASADGVAPMDWSGSYFGGMVGAASSNSDAEIEYGMSNSEGGWSASNGYFTPGQIYDDVNLSGVRTEEWDFRDWRLLRAPRWYAPENDDKTTYGIDINNTLNNWLASEGLDEANATFSGVFGTQQQLGSFVVGAELRASFGDFGNSHTSEWGESIVGEASGSCDASGGILPGYCDVYTVTPDFGSVGDLWSATENSDEQSGGGDEFFNEVIKLEPVSINGEYRQANSLEFSTEYSAMFTPAARLGVAGDRFLVFGMGGPTMARVKASTSASVTETGEIRIDSGINVLDQVRDNVLEIVASKSYNWQGTNTDTMWGYTVGGGIEFAATNSVIFRIEGSYTDLGTISVTGKSQDTDASYKVKQDLTSYSASTGMIIKF